MMTIAIMITAMAGVGCWIASLFIDENKPRKVILKSEKESGMDGMKCYYCGEVHHKSYTGWECLYCGGI